MKLIASLTSPYARKVRIALAEKKIEYDLVEESPWSAETTVPSYNPLGKVPVLVLDDGTALFDSPVILEYLDHLAGGGRILPKDPKARFEALRLEALADGILDASVLIVYEGRYRAPQKHEQAWLDLQAGKVERALAALEAAPPGLDAPPNVGQITLACALGYRDFRFEGHWRKDHPKLVGWLDAFAARVPAFATTTPPPS